MLSETNKVYRFQSHFDLTDGKTSHFVGVVSYEEFDPTSLHVELTLTGDEDSQRAGALFINKSVGSSLWLVRNHSTCAPIEVINITSKNLSIRDWHVSLHAGGVKIGLTNEPVSEDTYVFFKAELAPSGILIQPKGIGLSYTGEIHHELLRECKVHVETSSGVLEVGERVGHYESNEYGNQVTHSVNRAAITGNLCVQGGLSFHAFNEQLAVNMETICSLLSLCYRQLVEFYEVRYWPDPSRPNALIKTELAHRLKFRKNLEKNKQDDLINVENLADGWLDRLFKSVNSSPDRKHYLRSIRFLALSFDAPLEAAYFLVFSAFETIIEACTPKQRRVLIRAGKWQKLQLELRKVLDAFKHNYEVDTSWMKDKLSELRRLPVVSRTSEAVNSFGVKVDDLWPKDGFEQGLSKAVKMRNELFHSAIVDDWFVLSQNLVRVQTLTERIILKSLSWPDERMFPFYDQRLHWINAG